MTGRMEQLRSGAGVPDGSVQKPIGRPANIEQGVQPVIGMGSGHEVGAERHVTRTPVLPRVGQAVQAGSQPDHAQKALQSVLQTRRVVIPASVQKPESGLEEVGKVVTAESAQEPQRPFSSEAVAAVEDYARNRSDELRRYVMTLTDNNPDLTDDTMQQAYFNVLKRYDGAKEAREAKGEEFSLHYYLLVAARHLVYDEAKRRARGAVTMPPGDLAEISGAPVQGYGLGGTKVPNPEIAVLRKEERNAVRQAYGNLGAHHQRILDLTDVVDPALTTKEIAEILERPIGSIGPTRMRALQKLAEELSKTTREQVHVRKRGVA